jgi:hypothetical protein
MALSQQQRRGGSRLQGRSHLLAEPVRDVRGADV